MPCVEYVTISLDSHALFYRLPLSVSVFKLKSTISDLPVSRPREKNYSRTMLQRSHILIFMYGLSCEVCIFFLFLFSTFLDISTILIIVSVMVTGDCNNRRQ